MQSKHRLRLGDILLTASGTIGKLGIVSEQSGTVGAVAAKNLIVIRPKKKISPQFLKNLLDSDTYQEWLRGHARGATIQHLSVTQRYGTFLCQCRKFRSKSVLYNRRAEKKNRRIVKQTGEERTRRAALGGALSSGALGSALGPLGAIMGVCRRGGGSGNFLAEC